MKNQWMLFILVLLGVAGLVSCASKTDQEMRPYVCKAVGDDEDDTSHGGHFFKHPNPSTAKLQAVRLCREKHRICYIQYCNHDFQNQPKTER